MVGSHADSHLWPYYFFTTAIAVIGSTALVLAGLTGLAIAWTLNFSVIAVVMGLAPPLRRRVGGWFVGSVSAAGVPCYEWLGLRRFSRLLPVRQSPRVRLQGGRRGLDLLDERSRGAETSHAVIFLLLLGAALACVAAGAARIAFWTTALNVLFNGYPVLLQRYTRARLRRIAHRFHAQVPH